MFPISSEANANHLNKVERPVKRLLIRQYTNYAENDRSEIYYSISVYPNNNDNFLQDPTATMYCSWRLFPPKPDEENFGFAIIKSSAQQEKGQNSKLQDLGWGSKGVGNAKHRKFVELCKFFKVKSIVDASGKNHEVSNL